MGGGDGVGDGERRAWGGDMRFWCRVRKVGGVVCTLTAVFLRISYCFKTFSMSSSFGTLKSVMRLTYVSGIVA